MKSYYYPDLTRSSRTCPWRQCAKTEQIVFNAIDFKTRRMFPGGMDRNIVDGFIEATRSINSAALIKPKYRSPRKRR